jgi:hypothetical protein
MLVLHRQLAGAEKNAFVDHIDALLESVAKTRHKRVGWVSAEGA